MTPVQGQHRHTAPTIDQNRLSRPQCSGSLWHVPPALRLPQGVALSLSLPPQLQCGTAPRNTDSNSRTSHSTRVTAPNSDCVRTQRWAVINGGAQRGRMLHMRRTSLTAGCIHSNRIAVYRCDHTASVLQCVNAKPNSSVDTQSGETATREYM
jgi:hypothetical protein